MPKTNLEKILSMNESVVINVFDDNSWDIRKPSGHLIATSVDYDTDYDIVKWLQEQYEE